MRQCVFSNGGKSRATLTPLAAQASRNSFTGRPMLTNMKFACASVGLKPRSENHFIVKSRTALLRIRSFLLNAPSASCEMAAVAAAMPNTFSDPVPLEPTH